MNIEIATCVSHSPHVSHTRHMCLTLAPSLPPPHSRNRVRTQQLHETQSALFSVARAAPIPRVVMILRCVADAIEARADASAGASADVVATELAHASALMGLGAVFGAPVANGLGGKYTSGSVGVLGYAGGSARDDAGSKTGSTTSKRSLEVRSRLSDVSLDDVYRSIVDLVQQRLLSKSVTRSEGLNVEDWRISSILGVQEIRHLARSVQVDFDGYFET